MNPNTWGGYSVNGVHLHGSRCPARAAYRGVAPWVGVGRVHACMGGLGCACIMGVGFAWSSVVFVCIIV